MYFEIVQGHAILWKKWVTKKIEILVLAVRKRDYDQKNGLLPPNSLILCFLRVVFAFFGEKKLIIYL